MAGSISEEDINKVREASDIVAVIGEKVPVKQRGRDFWCCCPLHNEKTPSCKIDPALQLWHCFGCGEGGDVFAFIMKVEDLSFPEAVRALADRAHIDIADTDAHTGTSGSRKARLKAVCEETAAFYHEQLMRGASSQAETARTYLAGRHLGGAVSKRWTLGFAPGRGALIRHLSARGFTAQEMIDANVALKRQNGLMDRFYDRVMFPIKDVQGDCIAFGGRIMGEGQPKYLNSQETPIFYKSQVLYGLDQAKSAMAATGIAVVVEGYTDVIMLHEAGVKNVVATLGTALTMRHIRILARHARHRIVYLFDGDEAGQRAADRALAFIDDSITPEVGKSRIELAAVTLPGKLDPAEFVEEQGGAALNTLIAEAKPLLMFGIERRLASHNLTSAEGRAAALSDALSVLAPIKDSLLAKDYAIQIAGRLRMREQDVLDCLAALKKPKQTFDTDSSAQKRASHTFNQGQDFAGNGVFVDNQLSAKERAGGAGGNASRISVSLSQAEHNRRRFERELLSLLAQHPHLALEHADTLTQTQWHHEFHEHLATAMIETLENNRNIAAAQLIGAIQSRYSEAAGVLTSGTMGNGKTSPEALASFLAEELAIGDVEDTIASFKSQLSAPQSLDSEEYEILFESVVALQKDLTARRRAHKLFYAD